MRVVLLIIVLLFGVNSNAQKIDCSKQTKEYQEFLKIANYTDAFTSWEFVKNKCPKQSKDIYLDGITIYKYKIDNEDAKETREKLVYDLLKLYDQFYKNFPEAIQDYEIYKAKILLEYIPENENEIFTLLDNGFNKGADKITDAQLIYTYYKLYQARYNAGDKSISLDNVIEKYAQLYKKLNGLKTTYPEKLDEYYAAIKSIKSEGKALMTCENLNQYVEKNLEANKENTDWLQNYIETLAVRCNYTPTFLALTQQFYNVKATPKSAEYLGFASLRNRNFNDAKKYYEESTMLENDSVKKAETYYLMALTLYANDIKQAVESLKKAINYNPKMDKAYVYLSQIYESVADRCGKTEFEKKAIYLLAVQTLDNAVKANINSMKIIGEKKQDDLQRKALTLDEIYAAKMAGKSVKIDCEIQETIVLPSSKK